MTSTWVIQVPKAACDEIMFRRKLKRRLKGEIKLIHAIGDSIRAKSDETHNNSLLLINFVHRMANFRFFKKATSLMLVINRKKI